MESLERGLVLAKQVLSLLNYMPTVGVALVLRHFRRFQNPVLSFSSIWSERQI
jgi:hypothetical protein